MYGLNSQLLNGGAFEIVIFICDEIWSNLTVRIFLNRQSPHYFKRGPHYFKPVRIFFKPGPHFFKIVRIYFKPGPHFFKQVRIILNHVCALKNADFSGLKKMRTFLV